MEQSVSKPKGFFDELREQRWDDHRFYHQSYVNQSLHLFSALCFLTSYVLVPINLVAAVYVGGLVALWSRQIGHFFFEPKDFDHVNGMSQDDKEKIKVGFNLQRKVALFFAWIAAPLAVAIPDVREALAPLTGTASYVDNLAYLWLAAGALGFAARTLYLMLFHAPMKGLVWFTKILTDPFHDVYMYYRAPAHLLRGERLDPIHH